jgi:predicted nucleic-acid-binding protein
VRAVDTNVLVRLLARDDPKQLAQAEEFVRPGAWVSHLVLVETVWVLTSVYDVEPKQVAAAVEMLLDHRELAVQDGDVVAAALASYRKRPSLGFSDCLILEVSRKAGHLPLGTFDRDLARLEGGQKLPAR